MPQNNDAIRVLVVDDEPAVLRSWREILRDSRYELTLLGDPLLAIEQLDSIDVDVAILDIRMPGMDGMELLSTIKARYPSVEVVMMTGYGGVQDAVEAIKRGAYDFLSKPFESIEAAELTIRRAAELRKLERRVDQLEKEMKSQERPIVGQCSAMRQVLDLVKSVAVSTATVLIHGESGTGKELVAQAIHAASPRANKPLVSINCSALSETLLESELFGHIKGAFTDAQHDNPGVFVAASGGTLFLDEIGDMALSTQVKLLRALQEGEVRPVGATNPVKVDVRVIAATHRNLERSARKGSFREDLYYRLNVVRIELPALRERGEDIALLGHHLLRKHAKKMDKTFNGFEESALKALLNYEWPGNVRQLENAIEQAVVLSAGPIIRLQDLPQDIAKISIPQAEEDLLDIPFSDAKAKLIERFELSYLTNLLNHHETMAAAARAAGLDRSNFRRLLKRHNLN